MALFDLSWTPAGGVNSTGQEVQYKESVSSTWLVAVSLDATASSYSVEGLDDNTIYDFRIANLCALGGPTPGTPFQSIDFVCPTLTITPTYNSVSFSFTHVGGSVTSYRMDLLNAAGSSILAFKNITSPSGTVMDGFTGLSVSTNYNLRLTLKAGTYSEVCSLEPFASTSAPTCDMPFGLTVEVGEDESS